MYASLLQPVTSLDDTELVMVRTEPELRLMCAELKTCRDVAVDLEHHSYRTFLGFTCLMQLSTRRKDYIVDTLLLRSDLHLLNDVFTDPKIVKVSHQDIVYFLQFYLS